MNSRSILNYIWYRSMIKLNLYIHSVCILILLASCGQSASQKQEITVFSKSMVDSCDDPDANVNCLFVNAPKNLSNIMTIANAKEPGERLIISGTIFKADGKTPYPKVLLYAYHTDKTGRYSKSGKETGVQKWHGRLHGWCSTDSSGYYEIRSIRPARYPDNSMPAHIHAVFKTENNRVNYISDFVFEDDSLVNKKYLSSVKNSIGGTGVVKITKTTKNTWTGKRDIVVK